MTERTGGPPPMDHGRSSHDTKAAREEKQRVEKVREVDADEETQRRRKKFRMMMGDEDRPADLEPRSPSPFEMEFYAMPPVSDAESVPSTAGSVGDFSDIEDAIVPSPSYSQPPNVAAPPSSEDEADEDSLPQSDGFWGDFDFPPDQPPPSPQMQESPQSENRIGQGTPQQGASTKPKQAQKKGKEEASPFGPPGKPIGKPAGKESRPGKPSEPPFFAAKPEKPSQQGQAASAKSLHSERARGAVPAKESGKAKEKKGAEEFPTSGPLQEGATPYAASYTDQERERGRGGKRERETEIAAPSLPSLPPDIQPMAQTAAMQAAPYLRPETLSLFYQMVGTIYTLVSSSGISTTEIVLNNPTFADSKFFGATITIEKYETAPDSFNIRLTGSQPAVAAFKENIPSLMTAFQNGSFSFRVNRIDAEYSAVRPYFRRKERGEGSGGGDLKDRRK